MLGSQPPLGGGRTGGVGAAAPRPKGGRATARAPYGWGGGGYRLRMSGSQPPLGGGRTGGVGAAAPRPKGGRATARAPYGWGGGGEYFQCWIFYP